jgi:hypothetical protein
MNASEHLTRNQIASFNTGSLAERESREIGRHLLGCSDCRGLLPLPDPNKFWTAIVSEVDSQKTQGNDKWQFSISAFTGPFIEIFSKPGGLAWGGGLAVILTLTLLLLFTVSNDSGIDVEVAKSIENDPIFGMPQNKVEGLNFPSAERRNDDSLSDNTKRGSLEPKEPYSEAKRNKKADGIARRVAVPTARNNGVSQTRGLASNCGDAGPFEMEFGNTKETHVLKWKNFPNAVKYHLYVSDEDEILVDEFETERATSYTLTKPLDPKKSYRWKVIITLENGKTVNVPAQEFTAKDFAIRQLATKAKRRVETRCLSDR